MLGSITLEFFFWGGDNISVVVTSCTGQFPFQCTLWSIKICPGGSFSCQIHVTVGLVSRHEGNSYVGNSILGEEGVNVSLCQ